MLLNCSLTSEVLNLFCGSQPTLKLLEHSTTVANGGEREKARCYTLRYFLTVTLRSTFGLRTSGLGLHHQNYLSLSPPLPLEADDRTSGGSSGNVGSGGSSVGVGSGGSVGRLSPAPPRSPGAQSGAAAIQRRKKPKRRSTGVVQIDMDVCTQPISLE